MPRNIDYAVQEFHLWCRHLVSLTVTANITGNGTTSIVLLFYIHTCSVADRHCFNADPDPNLDPTLHYDADPDPDPTPKELFYYSILSSARLHCFTFLVRIMGDVVINILDSIKKFFSKQEKFSFTFGWNVPFTDQGSAKMMLIRPDSILSGSTTLQTVLHMNNVWLSY